jgi:PAS domain S-box-containing protein
MDKSQTKRELLQEVARLRDRVAELETDSAASRREEAPLRAALDATVNAIVVSDRRGLIEWVNPAFCRLTGYTVDEAIGKNPRELVKSGQHGTEFFESLWQTILSGRIWQGETINRRKDGTLYTEEQAITPVRDAGGEITHFIAVKHDITQRKQAEAELLARAQLAAAAASIGLSLTRPDSLTAALQQCAEALVTHLRGTAVRIWTLDERLGMLTVQARAGLDVSHGSAHLTIRVGESTVGRVARDRRPFITNDILGDPNEWDLWVQQQGMAALAAHPLAVNDRIVGVLEVFAQGSLSDTIVAAMASVADHIALGVDRYRATEALQVAEARMRLALQSANIGVWEMDYATGTLQWPEIPDAHDDPQPGTFEGTLDAFAERIHPEDRALVLDRLKTAEHTAADFTIDFRTVPQDGSVRCMTGAGRVLFDAQGAPRRAIGISVDVTQRRKLEEQYRQAQKMEAVGRLAGGVAHDFNNLLTAILGYSELILADAPRDAPWRDDLKQILEAGTRGASLTRQLLAFSRRQIIEPTLLDLNVIVTEMRPMLTRLIGEDVEVLLHLAQDRTPVVADRSQIEQVVMNLTINARDAMPKGGRLTIATRAVELDEDYAAMHRNVKPGRYEALTVTDTGTGMTAEVKAHLFEPFFTTKEAGKGTGLGLATVYGIVTQSGGSIGVYTELGRGTSVHVYFPQAETVPAESEPRQAPVTLTGTETILVVEDSDGLRVLVTRLLDRLGYRVLPAARDDEALKIFDEEPTIDLVLSDVIMPGASGPDLMLRLTERRPDLKVIYMSGYSEEAISHHGVLNRDIAFLQKPFTAQLLARKIRETLDAQAH